MLPKELRTIFPDIGIRITDDIRHKKIENSLYYSPIFIRMKKNITLSIVAAAMLAGIPGAEAHVTVQQAQQMLKEGKARKLVSPVKEMGPRNPLRAAGKGISPLS